MSIRTFHDVITSQFFLCYGLSLLCFKSHKVTLLCSEKMIGVIWILTSSVILFYTNKTCCCNYGLRKKINAPFQPQNSQKPQDLRSLFVQLKHE